MCASSQLNALYDNAYDKESSYKRSSLGAPDTREQRPLWLRQALVPCQTISVISQPVVAGDEILRALHPLPEALRLSRRLLVHHRPGRQAGSGCL